MFNALRLRALSAIRFDLTSDVTGRHYDQYDRLREKRRALELWSEHLQRIIKGVPIPDVILLWPASP